MGLSIGTLVVPFFDASYFTNEDETNFQCTGDKTDICVGVITNFVKTTSGYDPDIEVKWLQTCPFHAKTKDRYINDELWQVGALYYQASDIA